MKFLVLVWVMLMVLVSCKIESPTNPDNPTPATSSVATSSVVSSTTSSADSSVISSATSSISSTASSAKEWTIMVYLDADNNLESYSLLDLNEMERGLTNDKINVIVLYDRAVGYDSTEGDWKGTRLYKIIYDTSSSIVSTRLSGIINGTSLTLTGDFEELDMGNQATLTSFVDYCKANYPANNYMAILWNHGDGWRNGLGNSGISGQNPFSANVRPNRTSKSVNLFSQGIGATGSSLSPYKAICYDESTGNWLLNSQVASSLLGKGISVLGFDACLMGMVETAYELKSASHYLVASPDLEPGTGWNYESFLKLVGSSDYTPLAVANCAITSYSLYYVETKNTTMAVYDLTKVDALVTQVASYANYLIADLWNPLYENRSTGQWNSYMNTIEAYFNPVSGGNLHFDLWDIADKIPMANSSALKSALEAVVVNEWHHATGTIYNDNPNSHGMAIYFGTFIDESLSIGAQNSYLFGNTIKFTQDTGWDTYIYDLITFPSTPWITKNVNYPGSMAVGDDLYYSFYANTTGTVTITLDSPANCDDDIYLTKNGTQVSYSYASGNGVDESIVYTISQTGWYTIRVNRWDSILSDPLTESFILKVQGSFIK